MKHKFLHALGFVAAALLALAARTAWADGMTAPYYATPSWDQHLPASTRFVVLSNWVDTDFPSGGAAVLDRETGLVWERKPLGQFGDQSWNLAALLCLGSTTGGRKGWRLPSIAELASLVDPSVASPGPTLPAGAPFILFFTSNPFWSATTKAYPGPAFESNAAPSIGQAWTVNFSNGETGNTRDKDTTAFYWCVRGGGVLDNY
jgi:hypothetical protein